jgi:hypothetical protein
MQFQQIKRAVSLIEIRLMSNVENNSKYNEGISKSRPNSIPETIVRQTSSSPKKKKKKKFGNPSSRKHQTPPFIRNPNLQRLVRGGFDTYLIGLGADHYRHYSTGRHCRTCALNRLHWLPLAHPLCLRPPQDSPA